MKNSDYTLCWSVQYKVCWSVHAVQYCNSCLQTVLIACLFSTHFAAAQKPCKLANDIFNGESATWVEGLELRRGQHTLVFRRLVEGIGDIEHVALASCVVLQVLVHAVELVHGNH